MMVTTSILQLMLFVCIGTKFVHDIATIITDQLSSCRPYSWPTQYHLHPCYGHYLGGHNCIGTYG